METKPTARRGRPRKVAPDANNAVEGADVPSEHDGLREVSGEGLDAQADTGGSGESLSWAEFVSMLMGKNKWSHMISRAFYPSPNHMHIVTPLQTIPILGGEPGYQLTTGEKFKL